jgi:hypothetical protein
VLGTLALVLGACAPEPFHIDVTLTSGGPMSHTGSIYVKGATDCDPIVLPVGLPVVSFRYFPGSSASAVPLTVGTVDASGLVKGTASSCVPVSGDFVSVMLTLDDRNFTFDPTTCDLQTPDPCM